MKHLYDTGVLKKWHIITFLCIVAFTFVLFFPAISGMTVSERFIERLRILPDWWF